MIPETKTAPEGYRFNASKHLIPLDQIAEIDLARDEIVCELIEKAITLGQQVAAFKKEALESMEAFAELSAEKYGAKLRGRKGNLSMQSFDGRFKIVRAVADNIEFDERLQAAKALIDECLNEWSEGSESRIRTIVQDVFNTDKNGKLVTSKILTLRKYQFQDEKWNRAMQAINDSITVTSSKTYVRFYQRNDSEQYIQIALDPTEL